MTWHSRASSSSSFSTLCSQNLQGRGEGGGREKDSEYREEGKVGVGETGKECPRGQGKGHGFPSWEVP